MQGDAAEMFRESQPHGPRFTGLKVDRRTCFSRYAETCLEALHKLVGGTQDLTPAQRLEIENWALDLANLRQLQQQAVRGEARPVDVAAASHLAAKAMQKAEKLARAVAKRRARDGR